MEDLRRSGILLHPTSLPGAYGIGSFNQDAYHWVDFLAETRQSLWQVLPLGPTGYGDSPYQSFSSFAGNPYLISLEELVHLGLLHPGSILGLSMEIHMYSLLMAVVATVLPSLLLAAGIRRIGPGPAAVVGSAGPVSTILLAWYFLDEQFT
ncbi:MAG TPA: 4-alpha-glucanotransferase, partial [Caldilinea sp.]|nr:4-alpha-glucanotransferase [Caldilinea sp.]